MDILSSEFRARAKSVTLTPVKRSFYRSVGVTYLRRIKSAKFLDGQHSGRVGHRYNTPGSEPTLYLASSQTLATVEVEQDALITGTAMAAPQPRIVAAVKVSGAKVFDLTNPVVREALGIELENLIGPGAVRKAVNDEKGVAYTQVLGDQLRAYRRECDGLIVPSWLSPKLRSVSNNPQNLVLFMSPTSPAAPRGRKVRVRVVDDTKIVKELDDDGT